ncbi:hypothetical protein Tco_1298448 [Tanacetum coccineum]
MKALKFADSHNMVAYLEKSTENADFDEIVDFLNANPIRYALTISPTIYVSYIEQFWSTAKTKTVNNETQIHAKVDGKTIVITESSVRRDLHFNDKDGGSPRRQDTMGDRPAQTRFERLSKQSNDPPLSRVNTLGSGEDSMKLNELIEICTKLFDRVLALENIKTAQDLEITNLKKRVKKLKKKKKSRTPQLKNRLFKVRIESSAEKSLGDQEDTSKQGRNDIDQDEGISWFQEDAETQGRYGNDIEINTASTSITTASINITTAEPITTTSAPITTAGVSVSTAIPSTPPTTTPIKDEDLTIAQTLMKMKSEKLKAKGVTIQEPSESITRVRVPPPQIDPKDKGKAKMVELEN